MHLQYLFMGSFLILISPIFEIMFLKIKAGKYKVCNNIIKLLLPALACCIFSCNDNKAVRTIEPSFYYWKSVFKLTGFEKQRLDSLHVKTIYIKFFDVDWDNATQQPLPVAKINFADTAYRSFNIIPTVFITNQCIQKIDSVQINSLAEKIMQLTKQLIFNNNFKEVPEVQFDCDWTATTKTKYFSLLQSFKKLKPNAVISATIRLHQIKYLSKTGVPPVNKGLLMCYNMGNLKNPATNNSIIETEELKKYIDNLAAYPLPLDVALPLFNWKVLFRNNTYAGLIQNLPDSLLTNPFISKEGTRYLFLKDSLLAGYPFKKGDVLRNEQSNYSEIISTAQAISKKLKNTTLRVSLYHLDSLLLSKYSLHELETIYNSLR